MQNLELHREILQKRRSNVNTAVEIAVLINHIFEDTKGNIRTYRMAYGQ